MASGESRYVKMHIPFDATVFLDLIKMGFLFCVGAIILYFGVFSTGDLSMVWLVTGGIIMLWVIVTPIFKALNVVPRDSDLRAVKKAYPDEKISVSHPYAIVIVLITLIFGATLIGWIVAFVWAYAPGTVRVPKWVHDEIMAE